MAIYERKDSPYFWWNLQHKKKSYRGSTGTTNRSEAHAYFLEQKRLIKGGRFKYTNKTVGELVAHYIDSYHPKATIFNFLFYTASKSYIAMAMSHC